MGGHTTAAISAITAATWQELLAAANRVLQGVSAYGFAVVAVVAVYQWWRRRDHGSAYLALALGLFGAVSLIGEFERELGMVDAAGQPTTPPAVAAVLGLVLLAAFMACAYAVLLYRHHLLAVRRWVLWAVAAAMVVSTLPLIPLTFYREFARANPGLVLAAIIPLFLTWCGAIGEPVYRLWRLSRTRPAVQRNRLRALAVGFGVIVAVLVVAIGLASTSPGKPADPGSPVAFIENLLVLGTVPILLFSFAPPRWLRRSWRAGEEEAFNDALHDLLLDSPNSAVLADRALSWAIRLVGAEGGVMLTPAGEVLARRDLPDEVLSSVAGGPLSESGTPSRLPDGHAVIALPLSLSTGTGRMVVIAGVLTPAMGDEESLRLSQYSVSVAAAIDRMALVEAVRRSEEELRDVNRDLENRVRRRTQELEQSNRELQASNRELEAFSYTVSHDLRSPLRAIDGFTRILTDEYGSSLEAPAQRYLGLVAENAHSMGSLIDTLLVFSRMGRQALSLERLDPAEIARRVADRVLLECEGRQIHIDVQPMPEVESDAVLLEQVYSNLLGNAAKFTRTREEARVTVGSMPDPDVPGAPAFFVRDNGVGFDQRYANKLFGVFQRLHRAEEYEGFGAGLAIVERIVSRHGGRAWAESTPGEGATFYFTLASAPVLEEAGHGG